MDDFIAAATPFWHPVARTIDLAVGGVLPVTLLERDLVLWRSADGTVGLVDDLCSHRGTRLSEGWVSDAGCITCPYHAWEYAPSGRCTRIPQQPALPIPSKADVHHVAVEEHAGLVWACLEPDAADDAVPYVPEAEAAGWVLYAGEPMSWACQATRQIENFLDIAHFSVVHTDAFGNKDVMEVPDHDVVLSDDGSIETVFDYPAVDMMSEPDEAGRQRISMTRFAYVVRPPFWVRIDSESDGYVHTLIVANQPVTASSCRVYWTAVMAAGSALPTALVEAGEQLIFHADRRIVETQRPERVPLDLTAELHLGFDRLAVSYRRAMATLGFPVVGAPVTAR
jgi:vanillate O-demethylase monooxygenase subunit